LTKPVVLLDISHKINEIIITHNSGDEYCERYNEGWSTTQDLLAPRNRSKLAITKIHDIILMT